MLQLYTCVHLTANILLLSQLGRLELRDGHADVGVCALEPRLPNASEPPAVALSCCRRPGSHTFLHYIWAKRVAAVPHQRLQSFRHRLPLFEGYPPTLIRAVFPTTAVIVTEPPTSRVKTANQRVPGKTMAVPGRQQCDQLGMEERRSVKRGLTTAPTDSDLQRERCQMCCGRLSSATYESPGCRLSQPVRCIASRQESERSL